MYKINLDSKVLFKKNEYSLRSILEIYVTCRLSYIGEIRRLRYEADLLKKGVKYLSPKTIRKVLSLIRYYDLYEHHAQIADAMEDLTQRTSLVSFLRGQGDSLPSYRMREAISSYRDRYRLSRDHRPCPTSNVRYFGIELECQFPLHESSHYEECFTCEGSGTISEECGHCEGSGTISEECGHCEGSGKNEDGTICSSCDGSGEVENECPNCDGSGEVENECPNCDGSGEVEGDIEDIREAAIYDLRTKLEELNIPYLSTTGDGSINDDDYATQEIRLMFPQDDYSGLKKLLEALNKMRATFDDSCGMHVHVDVRHIDKASTARALSNFMRVFRHTLESHRRGNDYCKEGSNLHSGDRYYEVNCHNTDSVELRAHHMTLDFIEIKTWLDLIKKAVEAREDLEALEDFEYAADRFIWTLEIMKITPRLRGKILEKIRTNSPDYAKRLLRGLNARLGNKKTDAKLYSMKNRLGA